MMTRLSKQLSRHLKKQLLKPLSHQCCDVTKLLSNQVSQHLCPPSWAPAVEMARLQERNKALEELADYHRQLLSDSEWRFQEMVNPVQEEQRHDRDPEQGPPRTER